MLIAFCRDKGKNVWIVPTLGLWGVCCPPSASCPLSEHQLNQSSVQLCPLGNPNVRNITHHIIISGKEIILNGPRRHVSLTCCLTVTSTLNPAPATPPFFPLWTNSSLRCVRCNALIQRMREEESGAWGWVNNGDVIVRLTGQLSLH